MRDPLVCRCTIGTIDYTMVKYGQVTCRECGRFWTLTQGGWKPTPAPARPVR